MEEPCLFFRLLVRQYERASLIVTSNKSFADWGRSSTTSPRHGDPRPPLHHATTVNIKVDSYRLQEKKRPVSWGRKPRPVEAEEAAAPA
jgi:DNA replication protein DnaC